MMEIDSRGTSLHTSNIRLYLIPEHWHHFRPRTELSSSLMLPSAFAHLNSLNLPAPRARDACSSSTCSLGSAGRKPTPRCIASCPHQATVPVGRQTSPSRAPPYLLLSERAKMPAKRSSYVLLHHSVKCYRIELCTHTSLSPLQLDNPRRARSGSRGADLGRSCANLHELVALQLQLVRGGVVRLASELVARCRTAAGGQRVEGRKGLWLRCKLTCICAVYSGLKSNHAVHLASLAHPFAFQSYNTCLY